MQYGSQIKHIDYYDPPYSSYDADEITEEVISKILEEILRGLNIYLYLDPYGEVGVKAVEYFIRTGKLYPGIDWAEQL